MKSKKVDKQKEKTFLNLAGEFSVAAELNRNRILASVTYGASKSADVFALNEKLNRVVRIEVKATEQKQWVIGTKPTVAPSQDSNVIWVLVKFSRQNETDVNTRYFVLTEQEIHELWKEGSERYKSKFRAKNNREFVGLGVPSVTLDEVSKKFSADWHKVRSLLSE